MREIKFRAWHLQELFMYTVSGLNYTVAYTEWYGPGVGSGISFIDNTFKGKRSEGKEEVNSILMQFTGLHDKNGNEIYESDIVKVYYGVGKVIFENAMFMIEWIGDDSDCMMESLAFSTYDYKYGRPRKDLEIIGNIYENPELLK